MTESCGCRRSIRSSTSRGMPRGGIEHAFALAVELGRRRRDAPAAAREVRSAPACSMDWRARRVDAPARSGARLIVNDRADVAPPAAQPACTSATRTCRSRPRARVLGCERDRRLLDASASRRPRPRRPLAADYLGFGPVFDSPTKAGVREARGLGFSREPAARPSLPVVAIGGVTLASATDAGRRARPGAVISEIEQSDRLSALVRAWNESRRSPSPR